MILIVSSEEDNSTSEVIDWIYFFNFKFLRISSKDIIIIKEIELGCNDEICFTINDKVYNLSEFKCFWYRRSNFTFKFDNYIFTTNNLTLDNEIRNHLKKEQSILLEYFLYKLKNICINHPVDNMLSKIEVLNRCRVHNIKFPDTIITTSKKSASIFFDRYKKIITKNITQGVFIFEQNFNYAMTQIVLRSDLDKLGDYFYPTMFQQYIPKLFDIRVFFLDKIFYSCLILSQKDKKTRIDFRNYNKERPNRIIKFDLPDYLKKNLVLLLEELNLKSGSIDLVMDKNGDFYFLEVNPIGQFAQVSKPCGYNLEKTIASHLICV